MSWLIIVIIIVYTFLLGLFSYYLLQGYFRNTPFYPSSSRHLKDIFFKLIKFDDKSKIKFIDLGSGDGRISRWAARQGMNSTAVDTNPFLTLYCRIINLFSKSKIKIFNCNFNDLNLSKYNVIYLYILGEHMDNLLPKLYSELSDDTFIISNTFTFSNLKPKKQIENYYLYKIKH